MREGWTFRPLDEICEIKPPKREVRRRLADDAPVSFVPMNDLGIREKWLLPKRERPLASVAGSYTYFADGDVLLAKITPCFENGKFGIARGLTNGVGFGSSEFVVLRPTEALDAEFLFYFLSQDSFRYAGSRVMSGAVGHKRVPKEFIQKTAVPMPPLAEQKRIVAILDEAFAGIATAVANTEKNLANARELFESYLNASFRRLQATCEAKTISQIAAVKGGKRVPKGYKLQANPTGFPYITVSAFTDEGGIDPSGVKYIDEDIYRQISRYIITTSDVYISIAGTIGKSGIIPDNLDGANLTENACRVILNPEVFNRFFYFFTKTAPFEEQAQKNTRIAAQPKLALERLKTITLPIPPRELQEQMVNEFDGLLAEVRRLESIQHQKLNALSELKQSLLQKAFSGELTAGKEASDAIRKAEEVA